MSQAAAILCVVRPPAGDEAQGASGDDSTLAKEKLLTRAAEVAPPQGASPIRLQSLTHLPEAVDRS